MNNINKQTIAFPSYAVGGLKKISRHVKQSTKARYRVNDDYTLTFNQGTGKQIKKATRKIHQEIAQQRQFLANRTINDLETDPRQRKLLQLANLRATKHVPQLSSRDFHENLSATLKVNAESTESTESTNDISVELLLLNELDYVMSKSSHWFTSDIDPNQQSPQEPKWSWSLTDRVESQSTLPEIAKKYSVKQSILEDQHDCAVCLSTFTRPTVTNCGHIYCFDCSEQLQLHSSDCPLCRTKITDNTEISSRTKSTNLNHYTTTRTSKFRGVCDRMSEPLGVCNEIHVAAQLKDNDFQCPTCQKSNSIYQTGGSTSAWCDLCCQHCHTIFELKCFAKGGVRRANKDLQVRLPLHCRRSTMNGGSYEHFQSQRNAGACHYAIICPKEGGMVKLYHIDSCQPTVSSKFLAAGKTKGLKKGDISQGARLKSLAHLTFKADIYEADDSINRAIEYEAVAEKLLKWRFNSYVRKIQRIWQQHKEKKELEKEEEEERAWDSMEEYIDEEYVWDYWDEYEDNILCSVLSLKNEKILRRNVKKENKKSNCKQNGNCKQRQSKSRGKYCRVRLKY